MIMNINVIILLWPHRVCKNDRRPGSIYHVNDIGVYLGRQGGAVGRMTQKAWFCAQVFNSFWTTSMQQLFCLIIVQDSSDWNDTSRKDLKNSASPSPCLSGVARTSPMLGHSMGTLRLYELLCEMQKLLGGSGGILPPGILQLPRSVLRPYTVVKCKSLTANSRMMSVCDS